MACVYGNRRNCKQSKSYFGHAHGNIYTGVWRHHPNNSKK